MAGQKQGLTISAVERETGISKENLRIWERRYGFPIPQRTESGDRLYRSHQVEQLRLIKNLIDGGCKPSQIVGKSLSELNQLVEEKHGKKSTQWSDDESSLVGHIKNVNAKGIHDFLKMRLEYYGIRKFITDFSGRILNLVGQAWAANEITISEEHFFTEQFQTFLRQQIPLNIESSMGGPKVLLATPPQELHALGLLLVEIILRLEGATVISYGAQVPLLEIVDSVKRHKIDIVGLSLSSCTHIGKARETVRELRQHLPNEVEIWIGGATGARLDPSIAEFCIIKNLNEVPQSLARWHQNHT